MTDTAELLAALVRIDSCVPPGDEIEIARFVHGRLESAGIAATLDEFQPGRANVLARIKGQGNRPALIFSAHFDTMPPGAQPWKHGPFAAEIADGRLYGRGAADMKSGMAAMIVAAERIAASGDALSGDLVLAFSAGESSNCLGARRFVETGALAGMGALLVSEPSSMNVLLAEKGALWLRLIAHGKAGHTSGNEGMTGGGANAVDRMTDALVALRSFRFAEGEHPLLGKPSLSVGTIHGGSVVNLTPDRCEAEIDLRILPGMAPEDVEAAIAAHVGKDIAVERIDFKPPVETAPDHPFAAACLKAMGPGSKPRGASYYSDATILAPAFDLPMVIIGPGEMGMSGQTDEYCDLASLDRAADTFEAIARDWLGAGS
jgi:succinyl-diaminopimelate desuccinylase